MNELCIDKLTELCREEKVYGFLCILIEPDGTAHEYTRLVDADHMPQCIAAAHQGKISPLFQFYTDDAGYALLKSLPYTEPKPSQDSGLHEESNVNTGSGDSLKSDPDTSEDLWESEGGGQAPNHD